MRRPSGPRRRRPLAPVVDLVLLGATVIDLRGGATASVAHSLAAVYLGVSVAFGHSMVRGADVRFAHRFAGGPAPEPPPRSGPAHAAHARRGLWRHVVAYATGSLLIGAAVVLVGDAARTVAFVDTWRLWSLVVAVDALVSLSYTVAPRRERVGGRR